VQSVEVFPIVPSSAKAMWFVVGFVVVVMAIVIAVVVAAARGQVSSRFEVSSAGLRLRGDLYGRMLAASELRGGEARIVDLRVERELQPKSRLAGTAVNEYQAGWFRLRNGDKALLYLSDRSRAVYVPTTRGYSMLLSPQEPERFVERLHRMSVVP
jgi:hypothetical protein